MRTRQRDSYRDRLLVWLGAGLFRSIQLALPVAERLAAEPVRGRLRVLREELQAADQLSQDLEAQDVMAGLQALEEHCRRYRGPETQERFQAQLERFRCVHAEGLEVQRIVDAAGGDNALAADGIRAFLTTRPQSQLGYGYLGRLLYEAGDLKASEHALRQSIALASDCEAGTAIDRITLGRVLIDRGDPAATACELEAVLAQETSGPLAALAHLYHGDALEKLGQHSSARTAWKRAARADREGAVKREARERLRRGRG